MHGQYAYGFDFAEFLVLAAPRPVVILAATRDYVPIAGAWESFRDAKRVCTRLGYSERVDLVETDAPHGFSQQLREGSGRWMRRWLSGDDTPVFEHPVPAFTDAELACAPAGGVLALPGVRSLFDLNRAVAARLAPVRPAAWSALADEPRRDLVRRIAGIRKLDSLPVARVEPAGELRRPDVGIEKLVLARDGDAHGLVRAPLCRGKPCPDRARGRRCLPPRSAAPKSKSHQWLVSTRV